MTRILLSSVALWVFFSAPRDAAGQTVLWAQYAQPAPKGGGQIQIATPNVCSEQTIAQGLRAPWDVAFDPIARKVYWSDLGEDKLYRVNLDKPGVPYVIATPNNPRGVKLDLANQKIYWSTSNVPHEIRRSDLDGSNSEQLIILPNPSQVNWIDLDLVNGKIYWTDVQDRTIKRANLDGTDIETCLSGRNGLADIATDKSSAKIYWAEVGPPLQAIYTGDLTCPITNVSELISAQSEDFTGLELDLAAGRIYWTEYNNQAIWSANLSDGSDPRMELATSSNPVGITLKSVDSPPCIPATSTWGLVVLALLVLTAGTVVLSHRRRVSGVAD